MRAAYYDATLRECARGRGRQAACSEHDDTNLTLVRLAMQPYADALAAAGSKQHAVHTMSFVMEYI